MLPIEGRRLFVLDTNVLMHDPTALFRFEEHDIFLPMVVLEELDNGKKGLSEAARNVRQVSRFLDELMQGATKTQIDSGLPLPGHEYAAALAGGVKKRAASGRVFFQTQRLDGALPDTLPGTGADNAILGQALALQRIHTQTPVTLVSKIARAWAGGSVSPPVPAEIPALAITRSRRPQLAIQPAMAAASRTSATASRMS